MKLKHLIMVSLIMAIITIGAVSAADDADALAVEDQTEDTIDSSVEEVDVIADEDDDMGEGDDTGYDDYFYDMIDVPRYVDYGGDKNITFTIADDAKGNLTVQTYNEEYEEDSFIFDETFNVVNGKAIIPLKSFKLGGHNLKFKYVGDYQNKVDNTFNNYYADEWSIFVYPAVISDYHYVENDLILKLSVPDDMTDIIHFKKESIDEWGEPALIEIANATPTDSQINLGKCEIGMKYLCIVIGDYKYTSPKISINVIDVNPVFELNATVEGDVLKSTGQVIKIERPDFLNSNFELLINDVKVPINIGYEEITFDASALSVGTNSYKLKFLGDGYFHPTEAAGTFNVVTSIIDIPETYDMGDNNDSIIIQLPKDATGKIIVKANGSEIYNEIIDMDEDSNGIYVDLMELPYGVSDIEVIVEGNYATTKTGKINASYEIYTSESVRYGGGEITVYVPDDVTGDVFLTIGGKEYKAEKVIRGGEYVFYVVQSPKDLSIGNHTVTIRYAGDKRYPAMTKNDIIEVVVEIILPTGTIDKNTEEISLVLPENANGALSIKIYKIIEGSYTLMVDKNITFDKGVARYSFKDFEFGKYVVYANYTGDDYQVNGLWDGGEDFTINPDFSYPEKMIEGDNEVISLNLPGKTGKLEIELDGEFVASVALVNGKASFSLSNYAAGEYVISIAYYDIYQDEEFGEQHDYYFKYIDLIVQKPAIKASNANVFYNAGTPYTVQITGIDKDLIKVGDKVTFKIGNKVIGTGKLDKNGYASIKITQNPGTYKITAIYKKASVTKTVKVKHIITLKKVTVKRSAKKLVIQATVKIGKKPVSNKKITLKFNGKKYTAKTSKKGVVKFTIKSKVLKKIKAGKKVTYQATYLKDTVKQTVKVKK